MKQHTYAHYYRLYWRCLRMGKLTLAKYAHDLAHRAAISPESAMWQRIYDRMIMGV